MYVLHTFLFKLQLLVAYIVYGGEEQKKGFPESVYVELSFCGTEGTRLTWILGLEKKMHSAKFASMGL